jgi:hypothetical protein
MAENEILDVGNRSNYRRWRAAFADPDLAPSDVANCLRDEFLLLVRRKLRGASLYVVLKACGESREALREAIGQFKDAALARCVADAHALIRSNDPNAIARQVAALLVDKLLDRSSLYALEHEHGRDQVRHEVLERETVMRLEACKPEIVNLLSASLRGERVVQPRAVARARVSAETLLDTSLLSGTRAPSHA